MKLQVIELANRIAGFQVSSRGLAVCRMIVALMVWRNAGSYLRRYWHNGFYGDFFYPQYSNLIPQPSEFVYSLLLGVMFLSAIFMFIGLYTRASVFVAFLSTGYHLSLAMFWYRQNKYFLVLFLFLLCCTRCGEAYSLDSVRRGKTELLVPGWGAWLIRVQLTLIYLASAFSKTLDNDWRSGAVLFHRRAVSWWDSMPEVIVEIIPRVTVVSAVTVQALLTEYFLAIFLWPRRTRKLALWCGVLFHGFIELHYSVLSFSYIVLAAYFLYPPCSQSPVVFQVKPARFSSYFVTVLQYMDWLGTIRLYESSETALWKDAKQYVGSAAWVHAFALLPVPFVVFYPLSWFFRGQKSTAPVLDGEDSSWPMNYSLATTAVALVLLYGFSYLYLMNIKVFAVHHQIPRLIDNTLILCLLIPFFCFVFRGGERSA